MSVEWAFNIDDSGATGAAANITRKLRDVDTAIGRLESSAVGLDASLGNIGEAQLDAAIASKRLGSAQAELELALGDAAGEAQELTEQQLMLVKALRAAEGEVNRTQSDLKQLAVGAKKAGDAGRHLESMGDAELEVARAAGRLERAQDQLNASLRRGGSASGGFTAEQLELERAVRGARQELATAQGRLDGYNDELAKTAKSSKLGAQAMGALKIGAKAGAAAIAAVGIAAGAAGASLAVSVFHAQDFARATKASFASSLGSMEAGANALADIRDIAEATAAPLELVRETYGSLRIAGVSEDMARDLSKMRMDWMAMGEEAESAFGKLTDAMVEGEVTVSMFEDLSKNLGGRDIFGGALNLSERALQENQDGVEQLQRELKRMDPQQLLNTAIVVSRMKGELGATATAAASTEARLASLWESAQQSFVAEMGIDTGWLDELAAGIKKLTKDDEFKQFARDTGAAISWIGARAAEAAGFIVDNWDTIGPVLKGVGIGVAALAAVVTVGAGSIVAAVSVVPAIIGGVVAGIWELGSVVFETVPKIPQYIDEALTWAGEKLAEFAGLAPETGKAIIDGIISGLTSVPLAGTMISLARTAMSSFKSELGIASPSKEFAKDGAFIVAGMVEGIEDSSDRARAAATGLGKTVEQGVVDTLGIHSPSKVLEQLGAFTSEGFQVGVNDNAVPIDEAALGVPSSIAMPSLDGTLPSEISGPDIAMGSVIGMPSDIQGPSVSVGAAKMPELPDVADMMIGASFETPTGEAIAPPQAISAQSAVAAPQAQSSVAGGGGGFTVTFAPGSVVVQTGNGGGNVGQDVQDAITEALERVAKQFGIDTEAA